VGFVVAYVMISFGATPNPASALPRPLLVGASAALLIQAALWLALRNRERAAIATSAVVLLLLAPWVPVGLAVAGGAWWLAVHLLRRRRGEPSLPFSARHINRILAVFALLFAAVSIASALPLLVGSASTSTVTGSEPDPDDPDIVVILLDGYPRADAAAEMVGADNSPFLAALEDRGFVLADESRSNYTATWATLASMMHGTYLDAIPDLGPPYPSDAAAQYRLLMRAIESAPMLDPLRARGYEIVTIPPPLEGAQLSAADRIISPPQLTALELSLVQRSVGGFIALHLWPNVAFDQHRERTMSSLHLLSEEIDRSSEDPRFVLAHLMSPHPPMVWDAAGGKLAPPACFPECSIYQTPDDAGWAQLPGQLQHLNELVLDSLDALVASEPDATIVVMSDHGMHRPGSSDANVFRSFFAIRSAIPLDVPNDIQPTDVLSLVIDGSANRQPWRGWISAAEEPLTLAPYLGTAP
jgi:hypothetical protein